MDLQEAREIFGIEENTITAEDFSKRYKKLCNKYHPDKEGGDEEMMKKVNSARDFLLKFAKNPQQPMPQQPRQSGWRVVRVNVDQYGGGFASGSSTGSWSSTSDFY